MRRVTPLHVAKPGAPIRRYQAVNTAESNHKTLDALVTGKVQPPGATTAITDAPLRCGRTEASHD